MIILANKKVVFVIVEGPSDEEALSAILSRMLYNDFIHVYITYGDVTTRKNVTSDKIINVIGQTVKSYAKENHFCNTDFKEIIHIVDMDGAYIPDENIIEDQELNEVLYSTTEIRSNSKNKIINRNAQKSDNLNRLKSCNSIWNIPYSVFYMSCNLDHVLYNKLNCSDEEKENNAFEFARKYKKDTKAFCEYMINSDFAVVNGFSYRTSWEYIKTELHSLERHSNFGLYLSESSDDNKQ